MNRTGIWKLLCFYHHYIRVLWSLQILHQIFNMQHLHYKPYLSYIFQWLYVKLQDSFAWAKQEWMERPSLSMLFQLRKVLGRKLLDLFPSFRSSSPREDSCLLWLSRGWQLGHTLNCRVTFASHVFSCLPSHFSLSLASSQIFKWAHGYLQSLFPS